MGEAQRQNQTSAEAKRSRLDFDANEAEVKRLREATQTKILFRTHRGLLELVQIHYKYRLP